MRSRAAQIATVRAWLTRGVGRQQTALSARRIVMRSVQCERPTTHRVLRLAQYLVIFRKRASDVFRPPFRCEVHRTKLGRRQDRDRARLRKFTFRLDQVLKSQNAGPVKDRRYRK